MTKISRELAHRATDDGVYIVDISDENDTYRLIARWPDAAYYDLFSFAEIMRQAGNVVAHLGLNVPLESYGKNDGYRFLMNDLSLHLTNELPVIESGPLSLTVTCSDLGYGANVLRKARFHVKLWYGDMGFAHGSGFLTCLPVNIYNRLQPKPPTRESLILTPLDPTTVGRIHTTDVLLYKDGLATIDLENTVFIDHPLPHLPGIVLLEMFRQSAWTVVSTAMDGLHISGVEGEFYALVHPDSVLRYHAQRWNENMISVQLRDKDTSLLANGFVYVD